MSKVLFTISYNIVPEKREEYISLMKEIRDIFVQQKGKNYSVYEQKGRKNSFVEVFLCNTVEEFDALEDDQDEAVEALVQKLQRYLQDRKMKYTTLIEAL